MAALVNLPISRYPQPLLGEGVDVIHKSEKVLGEASQGLKDALTAFQQTFVMCDATKPNTPVMFASEGFYRMTGYSAKEVIGKNCRFLQGPETDRSEVEKLKQALLDGQSWCGRLLNYRKDGSSFWNLLTVSPVKDDSGRVVKFIGMQVEVSKFTEGKNDDIKRPNQLPVSLIRYDDRQKDEAEVRVEELLQDMKESESPAEVEAKVQTVQVSVPAQPSKLSKEAPAETKKTRRSSYFGKNAAPKAEEVPPVFEPGVEVSLLMEDELDTMAVEKKHRHGIDLATTLERIQKNFVITDPRLPDNPIIFASDDFLELTEYTREEIIGRNCRFLQGKDTDKETVAKIRHAIDNHQDITVQLLNYTKSGKPFWNLFHLQAVRDTKGRLQYFIGVQLDASTYVEQASKNIPDNLKKMGTEEIHNTANNVDFGLKELPDTNTGNKDDIWTLHSKQVTALPHKSNTENWDAIRKVIASEGQISLKNFRPIKPLGYGDTGSVHLVELRDSGVFFAMKAMDKEVMVNRNKVHRACTEREILELLDHPFLPTLYGSFQTPTHVCLITDFCPGGELFAHLENQKQKRLKENVAKVYAAQILMALEYLHLKGVIYRDLKPENILICEGGHLLLTDFDLSFRTETEVKVAMVPIPEEEGAPVVEKKKKKKGKAPAAAAMAPRFIPQLVAEPSGTSNSFVGTEEYIAPEIISGVGHGSQVDWWAFGIFIYEMLYGKTPFRGKNRKRTFTNVLTKELAYPTVPEVSLDVKLLIKDLLNRDPSQRLGATRGASEIKEHPWFNAIQWPLICKDVPESDVPVKFMQVENERRDSTADDDADWESNDGRNSLSLDLGRQ
uniref:non-specific serine/threonine protein kinase n=1 Tax=Mougeotia scalaris TaxID=13158 RepID=Q401Q5_MOUSC|nr:phototropin [Mougeotia scalaris]BAE20165.1 phototropin [Mougeotia scalaris]